MSSQYPDALSSPLMGMDVREKEWPLSLLFSPQMSPRRVSVNILVCTMILPVALLFVGLLVEHNIYLPGSAVGLIEDWNILCMFITFPSALLLLNLVCSRFIMFLSRISDLAAATSTNTQEVVIKDIYRSVTDITQIKGGWKLLRLILLGSGFAFVILNAYNRYYRWSEVYFQGFWTSAEFLVSFWTTNIYTSLVWGYLSPIISFILISIIAAIYQINKKLIAGDGFNLKLLSPDNVGGLKPLADLALAMCYITIPFQIQVLAYYLWIPKINGPFIIGLCAVITLSILMFVLPITITHAAMADAKRRMLERLSVEVDKEYKRLMATFQAGNPSAKEDQIAGFRRIRHISELYTLVNKSQVWPFDFDVIGRFVAVVILPLLPILITELVKSGSGSIGVGAW